MPISLTDDWWGYIETMTWQSKAHRMSAELVHPCSKVRQAALGSEWLQGACVNQQPLYFALLPFRNRATESIGIRRLREVPLHFQKQGEGKLPSLEVGCCLSHPTHSSLLYCALFQNSGRTCTEEAKRYELKVVGRQAGWSPLQCHCQRLRQQAGEGDRSSCHHLF